MRTDKLAQLEALFRNRAGQWFFAEWDGNRIANALKDALASYRASVDGVELPEPFGYLWHSGRLRPDGGYEAGFEFSQDDCTPQLKQETVSVYDSDTVRRLIAEAVAVAVEKERERMNQHAVTLAETARCVERERCAKVCEDIGDEYGRAEAWQYPELKTDAEQSAWKCAAAIREGGSDE
jgi:hypothetical protein